MGKPPATSPTCDMMDHHSSPMPSNKPQTPHPVNIPARGGREVTGTVRKHEVPMHVTKHPNPVGRPKAPRE